MFYHYFERMGKNLEFLGFGSYKIFISGGASKDKNFHMEAKVIEEARKMGR